MAWCLIKHRIRLRGVVLGYAQGQIYLHNPKYSTFFTVVTSFTQHGTFTLTIRIRHSATVMIASLTCKCLGASTRQDHVRETKTWSNLLIIPLLIINMNVPDNQTQNLPSDDILSGSIPKRRNVFNDGLTWLWYSSFTNIDVFHSSSIVIISDVPELLLTLLECILLKRYTFLYINEKPSDMFYVRQAVSVSKFPRILIAEMNCLSST